MSQQSPPKPRFSVLYKRFQACIEILAVIVLLVMMLHVVINALARSLFSAPIFGTLELTQHWYLPALALLGLVAAQMRHEHIVADLLFDSFPEVARKWTTVLVNLATAVITFGITWFGVEAAQHSLEKGISAGNTDFPTWPIEALLALMYAIFTLQLLWVAVTVARFGLTEDEEGTPEGMHNDDALGLGDDPVQREEDPTRYRGAPAEQHTQSSDRKQEDR